jgi:hypothetical protein
MYRRTYDKYKEGNSSAAEILKIKCPKVIAPLLTWLESHLKKTESIDISHWGVDWFYICVEDTDYIKFGHPSEMRVGFTVNVLADKIMWSDDTKYNSHGGNCFVRANKWKPLIKKYFGNFNNGIEKAIHFYKD